MAPSQPAVIAEALWYVGLGQAEIRQEKLAPNRAARLNEFRIEAEGVLHAAGIATDPAPAPRQK